MQQNPGPSDTATEESGSRQLVQTRRSVLLGAGFVSAAAVAERYLSAAARARPMAPAARTAAQVTSARPAWLSRPGSGPSQHDWNALRSHLSTHRLIQPGQSGYTAARSLFDPRFDYLHPSGVAYCRGSADIAVCLSFATTFKLPVRARSGGHSYEGWSSVNNGLVIDVSEMSSFRNGNGTVTVGSGIDLINFYDGLARHGKAVPGGSCPTVGIAGLALGGGVGVLARIYGLTSDAIESLEIVTADGSTLTCNGSNPHSDLYWASQGGGGGNFGVATSFTFRTHNLRSLVVFFLSWPWSQAGRVMGAWQSWAPHAPDNLWSNMHLYAATGGPPQLEVGGTYVGSVAGAKQHLDQLYHLVGSGPSSVSVVEHSYLSAMLLEAGCSNVPVRACDTPPGGSLPHVPSYAKSDYFSKPLDRAGIGALLAGVERLRSVNGAAGGNGSIAFDALGGAVNRVHKQATAFVHRDALFGAQYYTGWNWPGSAAGRANQFRWMTSFYNSLHPHANGQAYQNYVDSALTNWQQAYYGVNYHRLQQIKAKYDPHRLFHFPQAIEAPVSTACHDDDSC
jgi:FAD/FMN-containing dehydrogenase